MAAEAGSAPSGFLGIPYLKTRGKKKALQYTSPNRASRETSSRELVWISADDEICLQAKEILRNFYSQSFQHFANRYIVNPVDELPPVYINRHESCPADLVLSSGDEDVWGSDVEEITVRLKLVAHLTSPQSWTLMILVQNDQWMPFAQWLPSLPRPRSLPEHSSDRILLQRRWWTESSKYFRMLDLPEEIQRRIWLYSLGEFVFPRVDSDPTSANPLVALKMLRGAPNIAAYLRENYDRRVWASSNPEEIPPTNLSVLELSKSTRSTALDVLRKDMIKVVGMFDMNRPFHLETFGNAIPYLSALPHPWLNHIRRLELRFEHYDWLRFFKAPTRPIHALQPWQVPLDASVLASFPQLRELRLYFVAPIDEYTFPLNPKKNSCQRALLDMLAPFAAEYIHNIPRLVFTGFYKSCTLAKWLHYKRNYEALRENIEKEKNDIRKAAPDGIDATPLSCHCPRPCLDYRIADLRRNDMGFCHICRGDGCAYCDDWRNEQDWRDSYREYWFDHDDTAMPRVDLDALRAFEHMPEAVEWEVSGQWSTSASDQLPASVPDEWSASVSDEWSG